MRREFGRGVYSVGVASVAGLDHSLAPTPFLARIWKAYCVPLVRSGTVWVRAVEPVDTAVPLPIRYS